MLNFLVFLFVACFSLPCLISEECCDFLFGFIFLHSSIFRYNIALSVHPLWVVIPVRQCRFHLTYAQRAGAGYQSDVLFKFSVEFPSFPTLHGYLLLCWSFSLSLISISISISFHVIFYLISCCLLSLCNVFAFQWQRRGYFGPVAIVERNAGAPKEKVRATDSAPIPALVLRTKALDLVVVDSESILLKIFSRSPVQNPILPWFQRGQPRFPRCETRYRHWGMEPLLDHNTVVFSWINGSSFCPPRIRK